MFPTQYWINKLQLTPHPEGGYFAETYRSTENIKDKGLPERFSGERCFSTAIYFLLPADSFSGLHRIKSDEVWHFYAGNSLTISIIHPDGKAEIMHLGQHPEKGESFQGVVKAGCWFGAKVHAPGSYALVGCTVAPGFDFADFEMADRTSLLKQFPQHKEIIELLTKK